MMMIVSVALLVTYRISHVSQDDFALSKVQVVVFSLSSMHADIRCRIYLIVNFFIKLHTLRN